MQSDFDRRTFIGQLGVVAGAVLANRPSLIAQQPPAPIFPGVDLTHINIRVSNCGRSALFYHGLFGGQLNYVHSVSPNPSTPAVESWFVSLGSHFLSITPVFPHLNRGVDIDHISPSVRNFKGSEAATAIV